MSHSDPSALFDQGLCPWCTLRFIGEDDYSLYQQNFETQRSISSKICLDRYNYEYKTPSTCIACLNAIPQAVSDESLKNIIDEFERSGLEDLEAYLLNVVTPALITLRDEYYGQKYYLNRNHISAKEAIKYCLGREISAKIGLPVNFQADFKIMYRISLSVPFPEKLVQSVATKRKNFRNQETQRFTELGSEVENENSTASMLMKRDDFMTIVGIFKEISSSIEADTKIDIAMQRNPIYILGRYRKLKRGISQTPWTEKSMTSVSDSIGEPFIEATGSASLLFHAAGREDIDVLMLGTGRPFVLELTQCRKPSLISEIDLETVNKKIIERSDGGVELYGPVTLVDKTSFDKIKEGEEDKKKHYRAKCWSDEPVTQSFLDSITDKLEFPLSIDQKTPLRVLHRRTNMNRDKVIYDLKFELINDHEFHVYLVSSAGMYIKEFCHGDFKRTQPNISTLLYSKDGVVDIEELDVVEVELDLSEYFAK